jgi:hypothetical protein
VGYFSRRHPQFRYLRRRPLGPVRRPSGPVHRPPERARRSLGPAHRPPGPAQAEEPEPLGLGTCARS